MTPQQIVGLAVRLFAVLLMLSVPGMISTGFFTSKEVGVEPAIPVFALAGIMFLLALAFWFFPMLIAHKLIPRTQFNDVLSIPASQVTTVACVTLGLWLFTANALPAFGQYLSLVIAQVRTGFLDTTILEMPRLIEAIIELVCSAVLCFKAHAISRFFIIKRSPEE